MSVVPWMQVPVVIRKSEDGSTDDHGQLLYLGVQRGVLGIPSIQLLVPKSAVWLDTGPARALAAAMLSACDLIDKRPEGAK